METGSGHTPKRVLKDGGIGGVGGIPWRGTHGFPVRR